MAYNPGINYHGDAYIAAAGSTLANDIASWVKQSRDDQRQKEFNVGAATQLQQAGKISPEDLQSFLKLSTDKQGGFLSSFARTESERMQQQGLDLQGQRITQEGRIADMQDSRTRDEMGNRIAIANIGAESRVDVAKLKRGANGQIQGEQIMGPDGEPIPGHYLLGNKLITDPVAIAAAAGDNWTKFNKDVIASTGAKYGDWQNATNKRLDPATGDFVADFPAQQIPDPQNPGKIILVPGTTRRVPGDLYEQLRTRASALQSGGGTVPAPGAGIDAALADPKRDAIVSQFKAGKLTRDQAKQQLQALGYQ